MTSSGLTRPADFSLLFIAHFSAQELSSLGFRRHISEFNGVAHFIRKNSLPAMFGKLSAEKTRSC
jgi:hypothetical protein